MTAVEAAVVLPRAAVLHVIDERVGAGLPAPGAVVFFDGPASRPVVKLTFATAAELGVWAAEFTAVVDSYLDAGEALADPVTVTSTHLYEGWLFSLCAFEPVGKATADTAAGPLDQPTIELYARFGGDANRAEAERLHREAAVAAAITCESSSEIVRVAGRFSDVVCSACPEWAHVLFLRGSDLVGAACLVHVDEVAAVLATPAGSGARR